MQQDIISSKIDIDFQSFFYNSSIPMSLLTTKMIFVAVNQQVLNTLHYSEEEMIGKPVSEFTEIGQIGFDFINLNKLLAKEIDSYSLERSYKRKDGSMVIGANTVSLIESNGETFVLAVFHGKMNQNEKEPYVTENNSTLSKILSINPDIHYIMDIENKEYIYQNLDILAYFGYTKEDVGNHNKIEFLIKNIDENSIREVAQANNQFKNKMVVGEFVEVEYKFLSKNEGWKWLRAKSTPLSHSSPGNVSLSYGIIQDITHQKDIEQKLLAQEAFINQIANLVPDVVAVYDINSYEIIYSNLSGRTFLGYSLKEWSTKNLVRPTEEFTKHLKYKKKVIYELPDEEVLTEELAYYDKRGIPRWILVKSKVFSRNEDGDPAQILIVVADIDDYKTALTRLAAAKRTNNAIIDAMPDLLLIVNKEGIYTNVVAGLELKRENSSELIGKSLYDVLNYDNAKNVERLLHACLETGEVQSYDFKHSYEDGRPDAYFSNHLSKLNTEEVLIIVRDETQKMLAQHSLDDKINLLSVQNEQLERFITKNSELERFAYIIAHDLKEPLRSISAISELIHLEVDTTKNENLAELLGHLAQNASRMTSLIEGVLTYSKIDSERVIQDVNLDILIQDILFDLNATILTHDVGIELDEMGMVVGDETQIRQLFQNLISNAIKFQDQDTPKVSIGKTIEDSRVIYFVEDNGIGINPEFREAIFMMFKRVNNYEKYPGQGIGLSMCKKIIESHKGQIWIENGAVQGTRFCFTFGLD